MNQSHLELERALPEAVEKTAPSVVGVAGRRRRASGFAFREPDLIVTASHALGHRGGLSVVTEQGTAFEAELLGRDWAADVALLRVKDGKVEPISFREGEVRTGTLSLALGRPGRVVRASLRIVGVSARDVDTSVGHFDNYIETDRALPAGFAGGPLIDLEGRAIGMNTDGLLRGADITIPHVTLGPIVDAILRDGGVKRGYLGVGTQAIDLPEPLRQRAGQDRGAMVFAVQPGSAADGAGLMIGDVLLTVGATKITGPRSLGAALRGKASSELEVTLLRGGEPKTLTVTTQERPC